MVHEHIQDLADRLRKANIGSQQRGFLLQWEVLKLELMDLISSVETNLKYWDMKYGRQADVQALYEQTQVHFSCHFLKVIEL